jgi:probable HAF family extracellular repeat protein
MASRPTRAVIVLLGLVVLSVHLTAAEGPGHTVVDLGTLPGDHFSSASDINSHGAVVGWSLGASGQFRAFHWKAGVMTELPRLPGAAFATAAAINDLGHIAGSSGIDRSRAVLWAGGAPIDLGRLPGAVSCSAVDINEYDHVTGSCDLKTGQRVGFLWKNGQMAPLPARPGAGFAYASALNNFDAITGGAREASGDYRALVWQKGGIDDLEMLPGGANSSAGGLNDRGDVVGSAETERREPQAVLWHKGHVQALGTLPGTTWSQGVAVNELQHVVGRSGMKPFLWHDSQMFALPTLQGGTGIGFAINGADDIAGEADNAMGQSRAVIWTEHPELARDRSIVWDVGPLRGAATPAEGGGTVLFSASNSQNFVDAVTFHRDIEITGLNFFTSSSHMPLVGSHVRVKILADAWGMPGAPIAEFDVPPTSITLVGLFTASGGTITDVHRVNVRFPPVALQAETKYWIGASGVGFDAGIYGVLGAGDGQMMMLSGDELIGPAPPAFGDLMLQLQAVRTPR